MVSGAKNRNLVLTAMVFAVAMMFIDQTIVAIAIPKVQSELSLTATGSQWIINGYLLSLAHLRLRREARRRARAPAHGDRRSRRFRDRVRPLRVHAHRQHRDCLDHHLPRHPGRNRRAPVPRCGRHRRLGISDS